MTAQDFIRSVRHVAPRERVIAAACELLPISPMRASEAYDEVIRETMVTPPPIYSAEARTATRERVTPQADMGSYPARP